MNFARIVALFILDQVGTFKKQFATCATSGTFIFSVRMAIPYFGRIQMTSKKTTDLSAQHSPPHSPGVTVTMCHAIFFCFFPNRMFSHAGPFLCEFSTKHALLKLNKNTSKLFSKTWQNTYLPISNTARFASLFREPQRNRHPECGMLCHQWFGFNAAT